MRGREGQGEPGNMVRRRGVVDEVTLEALKKDEKNYERMIERRDLGQK